MTGTHSQFSAMFGSALKLSVVFNQASASFHEQKQNDRWLQVSFVVPVYIYKAIGSYVRSHCIDVDGSRSTSIAFVEVSGTALAKQEYMLFGSGPTLLHC